MTRRERLMATLKGEAVDRPAVSFYEIGGFSINRHDPDGYNLNNAPFWQPFLHLVARQRHDQPEKTTRGGAGLRGEQQPVHRAELQNRWHTLRNYQIMIEEIEGNQT